MLLFIRQSITYFYWLQNTAQNPLEAISLHCFVWTLQLTKEKNKLVFLKSGGFLLVKAQLQINKLWKIRLQNNQSRNRKSSLVKNLQRFTKLKLYGNWWQMKIVMILNRIYFLSQMSVDLHYKSLTYLIFC